MTSRTPSFLGVLAFGAALKLPAGMHTGFQPPHLNRNTKYLNNVSEGGQFLGRSLLRSGNDGRVDLSFLPASWVQMAWPTLALALETKPFFFCWDYSRFSINKLSFSETIGAAWYDIPPHGVPRMYNRVVFLPNSDVAPDGSLTADTIEDSRSLGYSQISQQQPLLSETGSHVFSVHVKKDDIPRTTRFITIGLTFWIGDLSKPHWCSLDTATGEISAAGYSPASNIAVVSLGDYWRISVHGSPRDVYGPYASDDESADAPLSVEVGVHPAFGAGAQWQGDPGTRGSCVIWGLQLETGTVPSDYIKTSDGPASNEAETVFAWSDGKITNPSYSHSKYMTASIPFRCISGV
ncbi:MAG: hypothetical protein FE835_15000 [Gammaproteobacteria bacterium]|nr:hypothetical protein [Gammaproteobacteria bacterium]